MSSESVDILLVDDRPEGLISMQAVLDDVTYNLSTASSGAEALRHVLSKDFAVILMDVQMPDMDGFETARLIKQRERSKDVPVIFITAFNKFDPYVSRGYEVGAADYLLKPLDPAVLKSKVAVFVDLHRKNRQLMQQAEALRDFTNRESIRVLAELEKESHRRYKSLADAIPLIVWRANTSGKIESCNQFWYSFSGMSFGQDVDEGWGKMCHAVDLEKLKGMWEEALRTGVGFEMECRLRDIRSHSYRWHLLRVVPEVDGKSTLTGWTGTATDIQDQKLAQHELQVAKEMADSANQAKSNFLTNISHEIRTPLGSMLGFIDLLTSHDLDHERRLEYRNIILRNGHQLRKLIDEILDLSKIEAGKIDFERTEVSVTEVFQDVESLLSLAAQEKGLELTFTISDQIPARIVTDSLRFRQILINIIGNGIKFSSHGKVQVIISFDRETGQLVTEVIDSGPGLTAEQIAILFQPFSQGDASISRKFGGTGLGLALSRRFARALGGDILVDEKRTEPGSRFVVRIDGGKLPAVDWIDSLARATLEDDADGTANVQQVLKGVRILLVEDSIDIQILISHFLTFSGAEVDVAANGQEGIDQVHSAEYDVVLMDIQMPVLDGYSATKILREQGYEKPIVALTAHAMAEEKQKCLAAGCNLHLTKPVQRHKLIECLAGLAQIDKTRDRMLASGL